MKAKQTHKKAVFYGAFEVSVITGIRF